MTIVSRSRYGCLAALWSLWCAFFAVAMVSAQQPTPIPGFTTCLIGGFSGRFVSLAAADFDRDSHPDLAILDAQNNQVQVRLTNPQLFSTGDCEGAIRCGATCFYPVGAGAEAIAAADIDGDNKVDLVIANAGGVSILRGDGTGQFVPDSGVHSAGASPQTVAIADLDRDGKADIIVGDGGNVAILYGGGSDADGFDRGTGPVDGTASFLTLGDFNNDGFLDIAAASSGTGNISVLLQDPSAPRTFRAGGSPGPTLVFNAGLSLVAILTQDFDLDGTLDLAVTGGGSAGALTIFRGQVLADQSVSFAPLVQTVSPPLGSPSALASDDFNRDFNPDLVVANAGDNSVAFFLGVGDGNFIEADRVCGAQSNQSGRCTVGAGPKAMVLGDLDGDGHSDVVTVNQGDQSLSVLLSSEPIPVGTRTQTATSTPTASGTATGTGTTSPTGTSTPTPTDTTQPTVTRTPTVTPSLTPRCIGGTGSADAARICVQGEGCAVVNDAGSSGNAVLWMMAPVLIFALRRRQRY